MNDIWVSSSKTYLYEKGYTCVFCFTLIIHYKIVEERNQSERIRYEDTLFSTFHCLRFLS